MANDRQQIFRKVALDRLSSPDQLETLIRVIRPSAWLALVPLLLLLALALGWSWLGSISTKVAGRCIILNPTGLADVSSVVAGRIVDMPVKVGDMVRQGQEVASVAQPELVDRIDKAQSRLRELEAQGRVTRTYAQRGEQLTDTATRQALANLQSQFEAAQVRAKLLSDRAAVQRRLLDEGLVTAQTVVLTEQEMIEVKLAAEALRNQMRQVEVRRLDAEKQSRSEVAQIDAQISEAQRTLDSLMEARRLAVSVVSAHEGRVVEVKAGRGSLVAPGSAVLTIERSGGSRGALEAVIYLPAASGKKVTSGMQAQVTPTTVRREEHGYMPATVSFVSDYPATPQSMMLLLQNEALVRELAGAAPPIEVRAPLRRADTPSGYLWSSAIGPSVSITSGTLCEAQIIVERQRPISLVIPLLRKAGGI
jgi:HlyD family secretion protein